MSLVDARKQALKFGGVRSMSFITFEEAAQEWAENWASFQRSSYKGEDRRRLNKYILPSIGDKLLTEITVKDLVVLHQRISIRGPIEANRCIGLVKAIYNKAIEWELYKGKNPALSVRYNPENPRDRIATEDELRRILDVLKDHPKGLFFLIILMHGLRKTEAMKIKWEDIDYSDNSITLRKTKGNKSRKVYFSEEIKNRLKLHENNSVWVFPSDKTGSHIRHTKKWWKSVLYESQVKDLTHHDLRATFSTLLIEDDQDIAKVSKALGHSSISVTQKHYNRLGKKAIVKVFNRASELMQLKKQEGK